MRYWGLVVVASAVGLLAFGCGDDTTGELPTGTGGSTSSSSSTVSSTGSSSSGGSGGNGGSGGSIADRDADTIADAADNCPDDANTDQSDQDQDGAGDACDCENDNASTPVTNSDMEDSDRMAADRNCDTSQMLIGITEGYSPGNTYVDTMYYRCAKRCDSSDVFEGVGEASATDRGTDISCDPGEVVVGIAYKDEAGTTLPNDRLDSVTLLCAPAAGPDTSPRMVPNAKLTANPGPLISMQCPEGSTAAGILDIDSDNSASNSDVIDGVSIICRPGRW